MHRHELDELTTAFVRDLQNKLPPHLSSFGPASPDRLGAVARAHVEAIATVETGEKALEKVGPLVADLLAVLTVAPTPAPAQPVSEATAPKVPAKK